MKVLLLNDGTYVGLESVDFPVEVDEDGITVLGSELIRIGGDPDEFTPNYPYFFKEEEFKPA